MTDLPFKSPINDMRRVLQCAIDGAPAFTFCPTKDMGSALDEALKQKWLEPKNTTFVLTDDGRRFAAYLGLKVQR